jgi:hypothetical protein
MQDAEANAARQRILSISRVAPDTGIGWPDTIELSKLKIATTDHLPVLAGLNDGGVSEKDCLARGWANDAPLRQRFTF